MSYLKVKTVLATRFGQEAFERHKEAVKTELSNGSEFVEESLCENQEAERLGKEKVDAAASTASTSNAVPKTGSNENKEGRRSAGGSNTEGQERALFG